MIQFFLENQVPFFKATEDNWKEKENQGGYVVTHRILDVGVIQFIWSVLDEVVFSSSGGLNCPSPWQSTRWS